MCQSKPSGERVAYCDNIIAGQAGLKGVVDESAQKQLARVVALYGEDLWDLLERYMDGDVSEAVLQILFYDVCRTANTNAHAIGQELFAGAPIPGLAKDRGVMLATGESSYFRGFIAALQFHDKRYWDTDEQVWRRDQVARRAGLYLSKAEGSANAGVLAQARPSTQVDWVLGRADHCVDCPVLAAGSPYYRETIPHLPREGLTACLGNCKCSLVVDEITAFDPVEYDIVVRLGLAA